MSNPNLADELDADYPTAWKPKPGDKLVGTVVDISEREGTYGPYPIVTVRTAEGEEFAVHAFHEVLSGELAKIAPKPGDELGFKYVGRHPERNYHQYRVRRDGSTAEVSWAKYAGDRDQASAHAPLVVDESDASTEAALEAERNATAAAEAERDAAADEIPF